MQRTGPLIALDLLRECRFVDLTHSFDAGIPHCIAFEAEQRTILYHYDEGVGTRGSGFLSHEYRHVGQWGTHVDPPAHFVRGKRLLDDIPVTEMLAPLVVLNIAARSAADADAIVTLDELLGWEHKYGHIPAGAFVALHTGWDKHWPDQDRMLNRDLAGVSHFPGWSADVLRFLAEKRDVLAIGHDTTDTDPGQVVSRGEAPLEDYWLRQDKWQIEMLANLGSVPASGAIVIATWPKPRGGSGFPARCIAICPDAMS
jgi:kynurenine formamidase